MMHTAPTAPAASDVVTYVTDEITRETVAVLPFRAVYGTPVGGHSLVVHVSHRSERTSHAVARRVA